MATEIIEMPAPQVPSLTPAEFSAVIEALEFAWHFAQAKRRPVDASQEDLAAALAKFRAALR